MANLKLGEPFGLDDQLQGAIDWDLAIQRIVHDQRSDFIYAPHLNFIYQHASASLIVKLKLTLKAGQFSPGVPLTIEVPKSHRMRVAAKPARPGPSYSRPGSILFPFDRLLYQVFGDMSAPKIESTTLNERSFSHRLAEPGSPSMFVATRNCWSEFQKALSAHSALPTSRYVLRIDIANFFGSINQHILVNTLEEAGVNKSISARLEYLLTHYTGERSSRGILQGINPSDLLGNYYMTPVDQFLDDQGLRSARYVDDVYIFVDSVESADRLLKGLIPILRSYDLVLNEAKSVILPVATLRAEEPDLESLFNAALDEIASQVEDEDLDVDYGFQSDWEEEEEEEGEEGNLELQATTALFNSIDDFQGQEENIERFCLPLFMKEGSNYAVDHVMDAIKRRPSMTQIYASYLSRFIDAAEVKSSLATFMGDASLVDWQRMWIIAALLRAKEATEESIQSALLIVRDTTRHDALRAVAAIFVGRYGNLGRRRALGTMYGTLSPYIQAAIYFSSRTWPKPERLNAKATWGSLSELHILLTTAMANRVTPRE